MTLKRKKRYEIPVTCSICKEKRDLHTIHGFMKYGGNSCCDSCFLQVKAEWEKEQERERAYEMTKMIIRHGDGYKIVGAGFIPLPHFDNGGRE